MLIHPSSGACVLFVELFHGLYFSGSMCVGVRVWFGWGGVVWCGVVWCGVVWCGVVWGGVVWCGVVWCGIRVQAGGVLFVVFEGLIGNNHRYPNYTFCCMLLLLPSQHYTQIYIYIYIYIFIYLYSKKVK